MPEQCLHCSELGAETVPLSGAGYLTKLAVLDALLTLIIVVEELEAESGTTDEEDEDENKVNNILGRSRKGQLHRTPDVVQLGHLSGEEKSVLILCEEEEEEEDKELDIIHILLLITL